MHEERPDQREDGDGRDGRQAQPVRDAESIRAPATNTIGNTQIRNGDSGPGARDEVIATYTSGVKSKSPVGIAGVDRWQDALRSSEPMAGTIP